MRIPFLDLKAQYVTIKEETNLAIQSVLDQNSYILGPSVEEFEEKFADFCDAKYCVALNSGTSALHASLLAHGVSAGDEVITVPNTFVATTWAIDYCNAKPVFVDVTNDTFLMDYKQIESKINNRTKAIIPVHLYGQPADMNKINEIALKHNLVVIEDAAQAHGAFYDGKVIGSHGNTSCFSFYPGKNLGAYGEGGALVTNDIKVYNYVKSLRNHAQSKRYHHDFLGYNYRMDGIQGAVLNVKLKYLDGWIRARNKVASLYSKNLKSLKNISLPHVSNNCVSSYHLFVISCKDRDNLFSYLNNAGVSCGFHYPIPLHLQKAYSHLDYEKGNFPNAEMNAKECLSLPMYPELTNEMVKYVSETIYKYFE
jgi:dTDP-4-amino-4,6-dideoxygalactose transaminase